MSSLSRRSRRLAYKLLGRCAALGVAGRLLFPSAALAADDRLAFGAGAFMSLAFGSEGVSMGYGVEGYSTYLVAGNDATCAFEQRAGFGPLVQFGMVGLGAPRLTLSLTGGAETDRGSNLAIIGEVGASYRFGERPGFGLHMGLGPQIDFVHPFLRAEFGPGEYQAGVSVRSGQLFGAVANLCVIGRPVRDADGAMALGALRVLDDSFDGALDPEVEAWAIDAQEECASVLAFAELAEQLVVAGAPARLIDRALRAGAEEVGHAVGCARVVEALSGARLAPVAPQHEARAPLIGRDALVRLAVESWTDGCLGEGAAASWAAAAAEQSAPSEGQRLQRRIAAEERGHAELAWQVLGWATQAGGDDVRHAVWERRHAEVSARGDHRALDPRTARGAARLDAAHTADVLDAHLATSHARLQRTLG